MRFVKRVHQMQFDFLPDVIEVILFLALCVTTNSSNMSVYVAHCVLDICATWIVPMPCLYSCGLGSLGKRTRSHSAVFACFALFVH